MTEKLLHDTQIGTAVEQVGGERVSQGVRVRGPGGADGRGCAERRAA